MLVHREGIGGNAERFTLSRLDCYPSDTILPTSVKCITRRQQSFACRKHSTTSRDAVNLVKTCDIINEKLQYTQDYNATDIYKSTAGTKNWCIADFNPFTADPVVKALHFSKLI